jgi:ABC-type lipoprotein release transport system permease subunit
MGRVLVMPSRSPLGRAVLICRLAARDLRHRPAQALLLLVAIAAATATLTLGLVLNGVTSQPYLRTKAATNGPDVVASLLPQTTQTQLAPLPSSSLPQLTALDRAPGVTAHSGPYPIVSAVLRAHGHAVPVQAEGRDEAAAAVDQPTLTQGAWVRPGGVVLERTFAEALGVRVGDAVTLNGRSFRVAGLAVTAATPEYPQVCYYLTCNADGQASESAMGLVWVTRSATAGLATRVTPLSYQLDLRLSDPASAAAFVSVHGSANPSAPQLLSWQQISYADNDLVSVAQQVLTPGAWLAVALAVASVAVLAGGRMTEQTRRVGRLKAVGAAPATVAAVLLAEHVVVALVAAAAGLLVGWLVAPLLSDAGAGLVGSPGAPAVTLGTAGLVVAVALGVTLATLVPAFRAARTSTVSALADSPRPPRRSAMLIAISAWLPVPLLIGLRLVARRPRRAFLSAASTAITVTGIVAVLAAHHAGDVADRRFDWFAGLTDPVTARVNQVMAVLTVVVVCLAAVNAIVTGWATALDARQQSALSRALGGTARQVSAGLSVAQLLPALPGALAGVPLGIELFHVANSGGILSVPPASWLAAVVLGALAAVALLTAVPARIGARRPVAGILRAELA